MGLFTKEEDPEAIALAEVLAKSPRFRAVLDPNQNPKAQQAAAELQATTEKVLAIMRKRAEKGIPLNAPLDDEKPGFLGRMARGFKGALGTALQVGGTTAAIYAVGNQFAPENFGSRPTEQTRNAAVAEYNTHPERKGVPIKSFDELPDEEKSKYAKSTQEIAITKGLTFGGISGLVKLVTSAFDNPAIEQEHATLEMVYAEVLRHQHAAAQQANRNNAVAYDDHTPHPGAIPRGVGQQSHQGIFHG